MHYEIKTTTTEQQHASLDACLFTLRATFYSKTICATDKGGARQCLTHESHASSCLFIFLKCVARIFSFFSASSRIPNSPAEQRKVLFYAARNE